MQGKFITIEGPDGAGKSTQANLLSKYFQSLGFQVVLTREPGGTPLAEKIRDLLLDPENIKMKPLTEVLLYAASRAQHVGELIYPALEAGKIVISDRFSDSSVVYQGVGRGLNKKQIQQINSYAALGLQPDLTILLDLDPAKGLERLKCRYKGRQCLDRLEQESLDFHRRLRAGYLALAEEEPKRIKIIGAEGTIEEIHRLVRSLVQDFLHLEEV
ncbi:dTMP kinase [Bacillota bacterium LX-D]|nr:dTMP kinase [Bacillota bacterium LX-D]